MAYTLISVCCSLTVLLVLDPEKLASADSRSPIVQAVPPKASGTIYGTFKSMLVGNTVRHLTRDVSQRQWTEGAVPLPCSCISAPLTSSQRLQLKGIGTASSM